MLNKIKNIVTGGSAEATAQIKLTRNTRVRPVDSRETIDGSTGQIHTVTERQARDLVAADVAEVVGAAEAAKAKAQTLADLIPPVEKPRPLPSGWSKLPSPFSKWWELSEAGSCLARRAAKIEQLLLDRMPPVSTFGNMTTMSGAQQSAVIARGFSDLKPLTQTEVEIQIHLRDTHQRATEALYSWQDMNREKLFLLHIQCSDEFIAASGELAKTCRELHEIGRELFRLRIGSLGLSPFKEYDLFKGSADHIKYVRNAPPPSVPDLKLLWNEDDGRDQRHYCGATVDAIACHMQNALARQMAMTALLKEGRAELGKATRAQAA